jgi:hypothetical protein
LRRSDEVLLRDLLLSFDFDQRRAYFGGGVSDQSINEFCAAIDWQHTTVIARSGPIRLDAAAILVSLPPAHTTVELAIACSLRSDRERVIAGLLDLALDVAVLRYWQLVITRDDANAEAIALLRDNPATRFGCESVEIDLGVWHRFASQSKISQRHH